MYQPAHFRVEDAGVMHAFIRAHPLGLLISTDEGGPVADLIPFLLDAESGKRGCLRAHMARTNPHWRLLVEMKKALVVFQAQGHYISPSWYPTKAETGKVVPTWNYVMVQVSGHVSVHEDAGWLRRQVEDLTREHEYGRDPGWEVRHAPEDFIAAQLRGIVGFEIGIERMDGKFKLSQNRPAVDRPAIVTALEQESAPGAALAALKRAQEIGA